MTATTEVTRPLPQTQTVVAKRRRVRIYQHSDLLYWWVVWLYGFICAGLTYLRGNKVDFEAHAVFVHPSPWIGISMIGLILFVTIFTNERARGVYSLVLALFFALVVGGVQMTYGWEQIFPLFQLLQVHANLAFYLTLSVPLFCLGRGDPGIGSPQLLVF